MFRTISEKFDLKTFPVSDKRKRSKTGVRRKNAANSNVLYLKFDVILFLAMVILMVFGLVVVYSASYDFSQREFGDNAKIFSRQLLVLGLGSAAMLFLTFFDYHKLKSLAVPGLIITLISLFAVLIIGEERHGAARSLLSGSIQPSEFAKFAIVVYLSAWLYSKRENLDKVTFGLIPLAMILGLVSSLILLQPDISAVFTIMLLGVIMFILAGGDLKQIIIVLLLAILVGWIMLQLFPTGAIRMEEFINGLLDPTKASYHVRRSLEAFVKGGWFGVGIGNSETKMTGLPVPHTDSVFAVVGEEMGVFGTAGLLILFTVILWRGLKIAMQAPDLMGSLLAAGLSIWIAVEAFINMAGIVNVLPFAGNALPFISAGGSSLFATMIGFGILMNISRQSVVNEDENERKLGEVVDLRRRNRRGSVPRARRSTSDKGKG